MIIACLRESKLRSPASYHEEVVAEKGRKEYDREREHEEREFRLGGAVLYCTFPVLELDMSCDCGQSIEQIASGRRGRYFLPEPKNRLPRRKSRFSGFFSPAA